MKLQRTPIIRTLSVVYLIIFIGLALYDEPLQSSVAEFLKVPAVNLPDAENAYFAQMGFTAPAGADFRSYGVEKFRKAMDEAAKKRTGNTQDAPSKAAGSGQLSFKGKDLPKERLYRFVAENSAALDLLAKDNAELLDRYRDLKQYRRIAEPGGNGRYQDVPFPEFMPIRSTQTLALLLALRTAQQGGVDEALSLLAGDLAYWRMVLRQGHVLISKLTAIASIQKDYQALSELIAHCQLSPPQRLQIRTLLPAWKTEDADFAEAARFEALYVTESLFTSFIDYRMFDGVVLKKNATRNGIAKNYMENARIARLAPEELAHSLAIQKNNPKEPVLLHPDFLYNPVGAILNSIAAPQFHSFFSRFHDLEAKRRMVLIHLMAREQGIGYDGMAELLKKSGKEYANPYTGQPMQWNGDKKCITVDSIRAEGGAEQRRVELAL